MLPDVEIRQEALRAALQLKPPHNSFSGASGAVWVPPANAASVIADAKQIEAYLRGPGSGPEPAEPARTKSKRRAKR